MVWFQCEDCGENLKKPKLQTHFYRCSAHKLSCIDCGVVFDQQSVQAHTSCVTETEKYGPKTSNRLDNGQPQSKQKEKQVDSALNSRLGLSVSAPWTCSLCNVNTTSFETLDLHSQGKKHCKKVKAATASANKEKAEADVAAPSIHGKDGVTSSLTTEGLTSGVGTGDDFSATVFSEEAPAKSESIVGVDEIRSSSAEKKRKKMAQDFGAGAGPHETNEHTKSNKHEKKQRRIGDVDAGEANGSCLSPEKKRKHAEELHGSLLTEDASKKTLKKSRKGGKHELPGGPLLDENVANHTKAVEAVDTVGCGMGEQLKAKGTKGHHKHSSGTQLSERSACAKNGHASGTQIASATEPSLLGVITGTVEVGAVPANEKLGSGKKAKRMKRRLDSESGPAQLDIKDSELVNDTLKSGKKEISKKSEKSESIAHEVSFRAWLSDDDGDVVDGKVRRQPSIEFPASQAGSTLRKYDVGVEGRTNSDLNDSEAPSKETAQAKIAKVVKWKRIIREVIAKLVHSVNGRVKKKEFTRAVLPLAQKAISSSPLSVDRKTLKAELMRQVSSSPKFVIEGKHIVLNPQAV